VIAAQSRGVETLPAWDNVVLLLFAGVLATLTYKYFENPMRHAAFLTRRKWGSIALGLSLVALTLAVTTYEGGRGSTIGFGSIAAATAGSRCSSPSSSLVDHLRSGTSAEKPSHALLSDGTTEPVLLIGDSTACTLLPGLQAAGPAYGIHFVNGAVIGCGIVSGEIAPYFAGNYNVVGYTKQCQGQANNVESQMLERYRPRLIVWGSTEERQSILVTTPSGKVVLQEGTPAWRTVMLHRMDARVQQFLSLGARVILVNEPAPVDVGLEPNPKEQDLGIVHMNQLLHQVAARHPGRVSVVDLSARVCPGGSPCPYLVPGFNPPLGTGTVYHCGTVASSVPCHDTVRPDGAHYFPAGSLWVAKWLVPRIAAALHGQA